MKLRFALLVMLFVSLFVFANINVAQAEWAAIKSGYAVTTDWHGEEVPLHADVTATAGTTNSKRADTWVKIEWEDPKHNVQKIDTFQLKHLQTPDVPPNAPQEIIEWASKNRGVDYWYAQSQYKPEIAGEWTVKAKFIDQTEVKDTFRATSFFAVDEVPFGTIVMLLIPFGFLGIYAVKRKHSISTEIA